MRSFYHSVLVKLSHLLSFWILPFVWRCLRGLRSCLRSVGYMVWFVTACPRLLHFVWALSLVSMTWRLVLDGVPDPWMLWWRSRLCFQTALVRSHDRVIIRFSRLREWLRVTEWTWRLLVSAFLSVKWMTRWLHVSSVQEINDDGRESSVTSVVWGSVISILQLSASDWPQSVTWRDRYSVSDTSLGSGLRSVQSWDTDYKGSV